jgi:hypothetical protein
MKVEIGTETPIFPEKEYIMGFSFQREFIDPGFLVVFMNLEYLFRNFVILSLQCRISSIRC